MPGVVTAPRDTAKSRPSPSLHWFARRSSPRSRASRPGKPPVASRSGGSASLGNGVSSSTSPAAAAHAGAPRVEVGGAWVEFHPGDPGAPEKPLLNHLAVLVDSADEHEAAARDLGVEIDDVVDAPNTLAVFVWGPERVRIEYVEHKPTFSLT